LILIIIYNKYVEKKYYLENFVKYFIKIVKSNSKAVISNIDINIPLSIIGRSKKNDNINFEIPVTIKLSVKNILNPSSIFDTVM
jgi:hypothetical protein